MLIKSPLNYVGGKFKLLPQILPLFPENINTFVDLFTGGCNVGANVKANITFCNDIIPEVIEFLTACSVLSSEEMLGMLDNTISHFNLSKTNQEGYLALREHYNKGNKNWFTFYALVAHSFNNQIRFNSKGEFNMPFGKDRSSFNPALRQKFVEFVDHLKTINIQFRCRDFSTLKVENLSSNDFVYADPPYLLTLASYNENGGWTEKEERTLYSLMDRLNGNNVKFALSNVTKHKGLVNEMLVKWSSKYNTHNLNMQYSNCNYQLKDREAVTQEVLITNY